MYTEWSPRTDYTDKHKETMKSFMDQGYSHREAERFAGASRDPKDFQGALRHTVRPSMPSDKMFGDIKGVAGEWLQNADRHDKLNAEAEKNPVKYTKGQMLLAYDKHFGNFNKEYDNFLNSDAVKNLEGVDRHRAVQAWQKQHIDKNPQFHQAVENLAESHKEHHDIAQTERKKNLQERIDHIITGGHQASSMTAQEAGQHLGGPKSEEGYQTTQIKDPSTSFAEAHPEFVKLMHDMMHDKQQERLKHIQSARNAQGVTKPEGQPAPAAPTVIRRPKE